MGLRTQSDVPNLLLRPPCLIRETQSRIRLWWFAMACGQVKLLPEWQRTFPDLVIKTECPLKAILRSWWVFTALEIVRNYALKMNPQCARCKKTVYPMEKLNCLDKYWHKGCFTCEGCNMTLTMKNYKGYNKLPYCSAHYPTTRFTAVADTPENRRLTENTKKQSNIQYHKDFEAAKGHYTAVADDPETKRAQRSSEIASQVAYTQHSSGQSRLGIQQRTAEEAREIQHSLQRRLSQDHPMAQATRREPEPVPSAPVSSGPKYRALYDYSAADDDEVSFMEGDLVTEVTIIDDGWMEGRVERTDQYGMLPSNYVEKI